MRLTRPRTHNIAFVLLLLVAVALVGCNPPTFDLTASPEPTSLVLVTSTAAATVIPSPTTTDTPAPAPTDTPPPPTVTPTDTAVPTATPTPTAVPPTPTTTLTPLVVRVEPTATPSPGDERARVGELPLGEPGLYVNITFGYMVRYPTDWYTGFGSRPLLVSFSDLDPGTHNRDSMRAGGCLIEINAATNIFGFSIQDLISQMPQGFSDAEQFELDGQAAHLIRSSSGDNPFDSEEVYVEHDNRLFVITFNHSHQASETCLPAWQDLLANWQWFTPQFAVYRNTDYTYAISHPRSWYRFNPEARGISISSLDPSGATNLYELYSEAMLVETTVYDNSEGLPLKQWLAAQQWQSGLTSDIPVDGILGVRVLREGPGPGIQEMSGYFQGPLGKIIAVTCLYPEDRQMEFRPIANAIIYSIEF